MRWILVAVACLGCKKPAQHAGSGSAALIRPVDAATDAPRDAPRDASTDAQLDAPALDATAGKVSKAQITTLLDWETIGPFKLGLDERKVLGTLGEPKEKPLPVEEGATGEFVADWEWTGITLGMASDKRNGPFRVRSISITAPSTFTTSRGVHIGSTLAEVKAIYPRNTEEGNNDPNQYLVGSVYGGMLFTLKDGVVENIFVGAMAF